MSSPEVRLAPAALEDLRSILSYTEARWSNEQALAYLASLDETFATLASNPGLGIRRPRFGEGVRSFVAR